MFFAILDVIVTQTATVPNPAPPGLNEIVTTTVATMTAIGAASIGAMKLTKRLLRKWLSTEDLGSVVKKQTDVLEAQGRILDRQVQLSESHAKMHDKLEVDMQRNLDISAKTAMHQDSTSAHLAEVAHQLERQHDRLDSIEKHMSMAAIVKTIKDG